MFIFLICADFRKSERVLALACHMVVATKGSVTDLSNGRILDDSIAKRAIESAMSYGAEYAELRLVSETTNSVTLKDGKLERAIPGQQVGVTMRILADGAWGVHSTSDYKSIDSQVESTVKLARAVASRRTSKQPRVGLAEVPIIEDEIHWKSKKDVRDTDLQTRIDLMLAIDREARDHDDIVSTSTGWSDEHIHTELLTSEGMNALGHFKEV